MTRDELLAMYDTSFADHVLTPIVDTGPVLCWRMARPGTRCYLVQLTFTAEGTVIQGDAVIGHNGAVSVPGYGLWWFVGRPSSGYLAEKFLPRVWCDDVAEEYIAEMVKELRDDADNRLADEIEQASHGDWSRCGYCDSFRAIVEREGFDCETAWPGHHYDAADWAMLATVQRTFARLFRAYYAEGTPLCFKCGRALKVQPAGSWKCCGEFYRADEWVPRRPNPPAQGE
jgi:hypothetical protein